MRSLLPCVHASATWNWRKAVDFIQMICSTMLYSPSPKALIPLRLSIRALLVPTCLPPYVLNCQINDFPFDSLANQESIRHVIC
jgi:hypothetical protein